MSTASPAQTDARIQELLDKDAIREVIMRYTRGIDRFDLDVARRVFHPDAVENHGPFQGLSHDWIDSFDRSEFEGIKRHHCLGQSIIELDGDVAFAETYVILARGLPRDGDEPNLVLIHARYIDRFERREGEWKIARRNAVIDYASHVTTGEWAGTSAFVTGELHPDDMVYKLRSSTTNGAG